MNHQPTVSWLATMVEPCSTHRLRLARVLGIQRRRCLKNSSKLSGQNVVFSDTAQYSRRHFFSTSRVHSHRSSPISLVRNSTGFSTWERENWTRGQKQGVFFESERWRTGKCSDNIIHLEFVNSTLESKTTVLCRTAWCNEIGSVTSLEACN